MKDSGFQEIINLTKELDFRGKRLSAHEGCDTGSRARDQALVRNEGAAEGDASCLREGEEWGPVFETYCSAGLRAVASRGVP